MVGRIAGLGLALVGLAACSSATPGFANAGDTPDAGKDAHADAPSKSHDAVAPDASEASTMHDALPDTTSPPKPDATAPKDAAVDAHVPDATAPDAHTSDAHAVDSAMCDPSQPPQTSPCSITDAIGVFVAPAPYGGSDATGQGTMALPFATIGKAVSVAGSKRVYACGGTYPEQLTVTTNVAVYGGLACPLDLGSDAGVGGVAAWSYTGVQATVRPPTTGYALLVQVVTSALFEDMGFISTAADPTMPGSSSIAVLLNESTGVDLVRVRVIAEAGAAGVSPAALMSNWCVAGAAPGGNASTGAAGGTGGTCACALVTADSSQGGAGGAESAGGAMGTPGTSTPAAAAMGSNNGAAGGFTGGACVAAQQGANGVAVAGGAAGAVGTLSSNGWVAATGGSGNAGTPGQGGGGGGGNATLGGAGGGAGGCGGGGSLGGQGGGASFAIVAVNTTLTALQLTLETAAGGAGGNARDGEPGQAGGVAGGEASGCSGGVGGSGAGGGGGGGGAGGPSVGIGVIGVASSITVDEKLMTPPVAAFPSSSSFSPGGGGAGGFGGAAGPAASGGSAGGTGTNGTAGASWAVAAF
jgi:hypothetical protein